MKIELRHEHDSVKTKSIYYNIYVDNKFYGLLRVSDHIKEDYNGFNYHSDEPNDVSEEELIEWLYPMLKKIKIREDISHLRIKNYKK